MKTSIRFVNHASILIGEAENGILSDPWYNADAFNKGWNLLYENKEEEILEVIKLTSFIWISHEHPDHFSINFFKKYGQIIKDQGIKILFQKTKDKRVVRFLKGNKFEVIELDFKKWIRLNNNLEILCIKDRDYDSGLLIKLNDEKILNLNDCVVRTKSRANEIKKITGKIDVLLTQFSYAAWKGGKENDSWRKEAALEKLEAIKLQYSCLLPKFVIPFASFCFFSNVENFYLNDFKNTTTKVLKYFSNTNYKIIIMKPGDVIGGNFENYNTSNANKFWATIEKDLPIRNLNKYEKIEMATLKHYFDIYRKRIISKNDHKLMRILRKLSPIKLFQPIVISLSDLNKKVKFDYLKNTFHDTEEQAHLEMQSESLAFIFKNSYGFDTLTVNGCFEELSTGGFSITTKTLALDSFNNNGIYFKIGILFNLKLITNSFITLYRASKKLN